MCAREWIVANPGGDSIDFATHWNAIKDTAAAQVSLFHRSTSYCLLLTIYKPFQQASKEAKIDSASTSRSRNSKVSTSTRVTRGSGP